MHVAPKQLFRHWQLIDTRRIEAVQRHLSNRRRMTILCDNLKLCRLWHIWPVTINVTVTVEAERMTVGTYFMYDGDRTVLL